MFGGTTSGFGGFGSTANTGGLAFGASNTNTNNNTSAFGAFGNTNNAFGLSNTNTGSGIFGSSTAAKPSGFGATLTFGSNPTTGSTFGSLGGFGQTANNNNSTSIFGQNNNQTPSPFGAANTNTNTAFGSNNLNAGASGIFGSSAPKPFASGFGTPQNNSITPFGSLGPVSAFGANDPKVNNGTATKPFTAFTEKDGALTNYFQNITAMPEYINFSNEELRLKDYEQGRRFGNGQAAGNTQMGTTGFGGSSGFGFGNTASTTNSAFGAKPAGTTAFGQSNSFGNTGSAFGSGGAFGQTNNNTTGGFGQSNTTASPFGASTNTNTGGFGSSGGFGAANNNTASPFGAKTTGFGSAFGSNTNNNTGNAFGNTLSGFGSAFGSNNNNNTNALSNNSPFGQNNTTTNAFGASNNSPFGSSNNNTMGGGLFGSNNNNNNNNTAGGFGASNTSGFGNTQNNSMFGNTLSGFGAKPATGGAFGSTNSQTTGFGGMNQSGGGLFGNNNNNNNNQGTTGGLFGNNNTNNNTNTGLFGSNTQTNSGGLFGNNNTNNNTLTSGGGLFGAKPAQSGGLFGSSNTTGTGLGNTSNTSGGLFGAKPATGGGLFGNNNASTGATQGGGLFGQNNNTNTTTGGGLFGNNGLNNSSANNNLNTGTLNSGGLFGAKPAATGSGLFGSANTNATQPANSGTMGSLFGNNASSNQNQTNQFSNILNSNPYGNNKLFQSITSTDPAEAVPLAVPVKTHKKPVNLAIVHRVEPIFKVERKLNTEKALVPVPSSKASILDADIDKAIMSTDIFAPKKDFRRLVIESSKEPAQIGEKSPQKQVTFQPAEAESKKDDLATSTQELDDDGYWTSPPMSVLKKKSLSELRSIENFEVGRKFYGVLKFKVPVDLSSFNLDDICGNIVTFGTKNVTVYGDDNAPAEGEGLNLPAVVTLEGCYPVNKATRLATTDPTDPVVKKHIEKLKSLEGMKFEDYDLVSGDWTFLFEHV